MADPISTLPAGAAIPRGTYVNVGQLQPLGRRAIALLVNPSFLDVLDYAAPLLEWCGIHIVSGDEFRPLPPAARESRLQEIDVIFGPGPLTADVMRQAPNLKIVSLASSGYESIDLDEATARGIAVTHAPTATGSESVADLTFGLILDVARQISQANHRLREGVWQRPMGTVVWGKTLGIVGLGKIGAAVATRAQGFGMTVLATSASPDPARCQAMGVTWVPLADLLHQSDIVSIHCRYGPDTHHLIGAAELSQMKAGSYLINTARPGIVDQAALFAALRTGQIAGAGLDVYEREPRTDDPIIGLPNVVVTPHIGNRTREGVESVVLQSIHNAVTYLHGQRPDHLLNPMVYERGSRT